jgi:hypothetical protein
MQVRTDSANVFKVYGSKKSKIKWNSYRACMRREGVWGPVDLNDRLTKDIFVGVMTRYDLEQTYRNKIHSCDRWNKTVNITVPLRISQLVKVLFLGLPLPG